MAILETLVTVGAWTAAATVGISATTVAVNWRRYAKSEWAKVTGNSFFTHCHKKYFQRNEARRKGYAGEHELATQLEKVNGQKKVLYNVLIPAGQGTTEIDALLIHETGIYVFENKNYSGTIGCYYKNKNDRVVLGNVKPYEKNWNVVYATGKKTNMYNPIFQNETHMYFIKRFLTKFNIGSQRVFSYITFNDNAKIKGIPFEFKFSQEGCALLVKNLVEDLNSKIPQRSRIFSTKKINEISHTLEPYSRVSIQDRQAHVDRIKTCKSEKAEDFEDDLLSSSSHLSLNTAIQKAQEQVYKQNPIQEKSIMKDYMNMFRG